MCRWWSIHGTIISDNGGKTPTVSHILDHHRHLGRRTLKYGWRPLDEAALALFRRGSTDGSIFFESDKMREWLFDFDPESMSDLVLLNAIYHPDRMDLFPEILRRKQDRDYGRELRDTYGVPVYQEQTSDPHLAPKGHYIGRTMMAVEALKAGR